MEPDANQLVEKARCGDQAAAARLIELFYERIYAFLRRLAANDADAADLTQRTFGRVWQALPSFAGMTKLQAKALIDQIGIRWDPRGAGRVVEQDPPAGAALRDVSLCRLTFSSEASEETKTNEATRSPKVARL